MTRLLFQSPVSMRSISSRSSSGPLQRECVSGGSPRFSRERDRWNAENPQGPSQNPKLHNENRDDVAPIVQEVTRSSGQLLHRGAGALFAAQFGHDFSRVQIHAAGSTTQARCTESINIVGTQAMTAPEIFINGPDQGSGGQPHSPPAAQQQTFRAPAVSNCPTDIRVASVGQGNDVEFGRTGPITGWGGFARMEVSDASGRNWDGTEIHENLRNVKNSCGNQGNLACSNRSGEGGRTGSTFKIGSASNFLGLSPLPAVRNRFYDIHAFASRGSSLLHMIDQPRCEIECEQFYDCDNRRFGPEFVITYSMTRDLVPRAAGGFNAVTRVTVSKAAKSAAASPSGRGSTP